MYLHNLLIGSGLIMDVVGVMVLLYSDWNEDNMYSKNSPKWKTAKQDEKGNLNLSHSLSKKQWHHKIGLFLLIFGFLLQFIAVFV